jgi:lipopolysaccharide assembly outer membrane protein LptD (OstA)
MNGLRKFSLIYFFLGPLLVVILSLVTTTVAAQRIPNKDFDSLLTKRADTIPLKKDSPSIASDTIPDITDSLNFASSDTIPGSDSMVQKIDTFSVKLSKDTLTAPLQYYAEDSVVVKIKTKKILLYGKTKTEYQDVVLTAPQVSVDQATQLMTAVNSRDSTGMVLEDANFKQGENEFTSDTIVYNFKTQKGLTRNTITQSGEMFVHGELVKKVDDDVTFVKRGFFTTCNLDEPHFGFRADKLKVISKKVAVSGPTHPEFEGVPVPVYLPFGFFPLSQGRKSGLLPPQFETNEQFGLGLTGLGYYKVFNQYWDTKFYGDIYSYGGWAANVNPTYRKRYRYAGAFNFGLRNTKRNFKGDPDFFSNNTFTLTWNHSSDTRARPGTSFQANVNASSTTHNENVPNDPRINFQNQLGSSIAYSKTWVDKPYNLTVSANHTQNNQTRLVNLSLPDAGFTVSTLYPFQKKDFAGSRKWYEQLGIAYNGSFRNQVSFYDTAFKLRNLVDTLQWGAQHSIPISLSLPPLLGGALVVSPGISYSQVWVAQKRKLLWNDTAQKIDTSTQKSFFLDQQTSFSLSFNTALFGTFQLKKGKALRHVIRPTFSINYAPSLSKKYWDTVTTSSGQQIKYSQLQGGLYSGYSDITNGGISFGIDNNLEMKYRPKRDTTEGEEAEPKYLRIIDGFGFNGSYNFLADSNKLSRINLYFRNNLFEKINLSASANMSPYARNRFGQDSSLYIWKDTARDFSLGRIVSGSVSLSTTFQSKPRDEQKDKEKNEQLQNEMNDPVLAGDRQRLLDYMQQNPAEFVDFNIPWQISLSYSLYFSEQMKPDYSGFDKIVNSNVSLSGSFSLTPKWNLSISNVNYDFRTKEIQTFTVSINREMHCWQMSINVTPIGPYRYFNFSISPKSGMLQDLRINRTRSFFTGY